MPNIVKITVENPDEILNAGAYAAGALIRLQTSATEAGAYADVSGTGSTPTIPVVTAVRTYTGYDPAGTVSSWYRSRYENAGGTRVSDWTPAFQVGDETAGLLASLYDVQQELGGTVGADTAADENILDKIRQVSVAIEGYTGRWFAPRPTNPAGTATYTFHSTAGLRLAIPRGIRSVTTLALATYGQPETGGTYTTQTAANYYLEPTSGERDPGWPATSIRLRKETSSRFYDATFGAQVTGSFGWAAVPADIQGVAIRAAIRRYIGKSGGGVSIAVGPAGTEFLLPDMSGSDRATLDWYKDIASKVAA